MKKREDTGSRTDDVVTPDDELIQPLEPRAEADDRPADDDNDVVVEDDDMEDDAAADEDKDDL